MRAPSSVRSGSDREAGHPTRKRHGGRGGLRYPRRLVGALHVDRVGGRLPSAMRGDVRQLVEEQLHPRCRLLAQAGPGAKTNRARQPRRLRRRWPARVGGASVGVDAGNGSGRSKVQRESIALCRQQRLPAAVGERRGRPAESRSPIPTAPSAPPRASSSCATARLPDERC